MGFRYRRSIGLGGGVRLNVSKRGFSSVSVGRSGAMLNLGRRGVRSTVGLPGTGLSYSTGSGGGAGAIVALIGLVGAGLGLALWLLGAAARGSRVVQLVVAAIAAFVLFASLRMPDQGHAEPSAVPAIEGRPPVVSAPAASAVAPSSVPAAAPLRPEAEMRTITGANLRSGPSLQARAVDQLPAGALVDVIGGEGPWAKVHTNGGKATGWVAWSLLSRP